MKVKDGSALVSKLEATEILVRQQAEEKKELQQLVAYYRSLLEAAGLLPQDSSEGLSSEQANAQQKQVPSV